MDEQSANDPMTLRMPRWFSVTVAAIAESILVVVTLVIIAAMWLPAYLTNSGQSTLTPSNGMPHAEPMHVPHQQ